MFRDCSHGKKSILSCTCSTGELLSGRAIRSMPSVQLYPFLLHTYTLKILSKHHENVSIKVSDVSYWCCWQRPASFSSVYEKVQKPSTGIFTALALPGPVLLHCSICFGLQLCHLLLFLSFYANVGWIFLVCTSIGVRFIFAGRELPSALSLFSSQHSSRVLNNYFLGSCSYSSSPSSPSEFTLQHGWDLLFIIEGFKRKQHCQTEFSSSSEMLSKKILYCSFLVAVVIKMLFLFLEAFYRCFLLLSTSLTNSI